MTPPTGRDRLRVLLDAVLDEDHDRLSAMAEGAHASPFHFSREVSRLSGESPAAMRRRVMLERAAWQLRGGSSVTDVAFAAGYDSVEGFSRAFARAYGYPPSRTPSAGDPWLPTPNGVHFHPPTSLWIGTQGGDSSMGEVTSLMVHQDVDDVRLLLDAAKNLHEQDDAALAGLRELVATKEIWLASIAGEELPGPAPSDVLGLIERHEDVAPRWLATVREIDRRGGWNDRLVDALCDPPESFVLAGVLAHVLTFSIARRQEVRARLRAAGVLPTPAAASRDDADPLNWIRTRMSGNP